MFLIKIFDFLKGYVIIGLKGFYIERFINICVRRGIRLWEIKRTGKNSANIAVSISGFKKIRPVAKKTYTSVRIQKKCGLPILLYKHRKRHILFVGIICFVLFFAIMSRFVWVIEIQGEDKVLEQTIKAAAYDAGIYEGVLKSKLTDSQKLRDVIMSRIDGLAWAWVHIQGSKAVIEVREKILPPEVIDKNMPCDVIAMRDGLIKKVIVKEGRCDLKPGDAVLAGEVVIAGTLNSETTGQRLVHALGTVEASTWHEESGDYKLYKEIRNPTGNKKTHNTLYLFSKKINLFFNNSISYEDYDTIESRKELKIAKDNYLGISLESVTYKEVDVIREAVPVETVIESAKNQLEEKIAKQLLPGAVLVDRNITHTQIDNETIRVNVTIEFVEKIGTEQKIG